MLAGIGNGVFHPVDFTLLNRKVSAPRLGHAYSVHGISGSLGWALAPALVVGLTLAFSWRWALVGAGLVALGVLVILLLNRQKLALPPAPVSRGLPATDHSMGFLMIPAVWMCFAFFFVYAIALGTVNAFAPEAARQLHEVPFSLVAICLTVYMVGSASGMVAGGFLAANPERCERIVAIGFGLAACVALTLALADLSPAAVPVLFGLMGLASGVAGPSRDLLVKRSTPENATGRVYGVVYAGLDIGQAVSPLIFGVMMDKGQFRGVLLGLALVQCLLIIGGFNVRRVPRVAA